MNKWLRHTLTGLAALVVLAAAAAWLGTWLGDRKAQRHVDVAIHPVALRSDAASVERGRYLYLSRGCAVCHGMDGSGGDVVNDGKGMLIHAPNLTGGAGGVVAGYQADDWVRTIRHGVKPDGRPLMVMPSEDYNRFTDDDLAAVVAYVRQLAPKTGTGAQIQLPMLVKILYAAGVVPDAAERIDHSLPPGTPVPEAVTAEHGAYVANSCIGCHGANLSGGKVPGGPPEWPPAANLTPGEGGVMARYPDAASFVAMLRSGQRPDGSAVSEVMPFMALKALNDTDAQALYLHLKRLPPYRTGAR